MKNKAILVLSVIILALTLVGCSTKAETVSYNLSKDADQFRIQRRIVFFNGITDRYLLTIEGRCSINVDNEDGQLEVTCKIGDDQYKKHFLGLSDNVSYFVEQTESKNVSEYNYKVLFRPEEIVPDIDVDTSNKN